MSDRSSELTLAQLEVGARAYVRGIRTNGLLRRRLVDLGFVPGSPVEVVMPSPGGDPVVYRIKDTQIALRRSDADLVQVAAEPAIAEGEERAISCGVAFTACNGCTQQKDVPGLNRSALTVALAGNPNTGKSTVFNALTGLRQHVGNWPGKTVTRAEGWWSHGGQRFRIVDLPGTYSLLSTSTDEEIARDYILFGAPDCSVVVADATALERNLNLAFQVLEITNRVVVCVNLIDEAKRWGVDIDIHALSEELGVPTVATAARRGQGLDELKQTIHAVATGALEPSPRRVPYDDELQRAVDDLVPLIEAVIPDLPNARWIAMRLIDGGDDRLREEMANGVLAELAGRIGSGSLRDGMRPDRADVKR